MKISSPVVLGLLALVSGTVARRGNRFKAHDDNDPLHQKSRVTAFVVADEGLKVECWEIGDLLPESQVTQAGGSKGTVRRQRLTGHIDHIELLTFAPSSTIISLGAGEVQNNAIDFRAQPHLFTVKDGLIHIEAYPSGNSIGARDEDEEHYVFASLNGDDWFYFEDTTTSGLETCAEKTTVIDPFHVRTISGSDTTLVNFQYKSAPQHKVLHEGRCDFAGLKPISGHGKSDPDSGRFRFHSQEV